MRVLAVVVALSLFAGCEGRSDDNTLRSSPSSSDADNGLPRFEGPGECDDNASCVAGFMLDGTFYSVSCGPIRPEAVTDDILAEGVFSGVPTEMRRIADVNPGLLVAIRLDGGSCAEGDQVLSPWSMAFPGNSARRPETADAICRVTFEEHLERNHCGQPRE